MTSTLSNTIFRSYSTSFRPSPFPSPSRPSESSPYRPLVKEPYTVRVRVRPRSSALTEGTGPKYTSGIEEGGRGGEDRQADRQAEFSF